MVHKSRKFIEIAQKSQKILFQEIVCLILLISFSFNFALAATDSFPEVMAGKTKLVVSDDAKGLSTKTSDYVRSSSVVQNYSHLMASAWVKPDLSASLNAKYQTVIGHNRLLSYNGSVTSAGWAMGIYEDATSLYIRFSIANGTTGYSPVSSSAVLKSSISGDWHNIAVRWEATDNKVTYFWDGSIKGTSPVSSGNISVTGKFFVGDGITSTPTLGYQGKIDEVRCYSINTSDDTTANNIVFNYASQINLAESDLSGSNQTLILNWNFNDVTASNRVASDASPNNIAGTLSSGVLFSENVLIGSSKTYYSGFAGNEAVINYNPSGQQRTREISPSLKYDNWSQGVRISQPIGTKAGSLDNASGSITVSTWIKPTAWANAGHDSHFVFDSSNRFGIAGNNIRWISTNVGGTVTRNICYASNGSLNQWNFVTTSYDKATRTIKNYLNGKVVSATCDSYLATRDMVTTSGDIFIGNAYVDGSWGTNGNIFQAEIFNRALTDDEVLNDFSGNNITSGLLGQWNVGAMAGLKVRDATGKGNDGQLFLGNGTTTPDYTNGPSVDSTSYSVNTGLSDIELYGFDQTRLTSCLDGLAFAQTLDNCFVKNDRTSSGIRIMSSRTYSGTGSDTTPIIETAALYYPDNSIVGDTVGDLGSNFAYWGRNTSQASTSSDAAWKQNGTINSDAQANMTSAQFKNFKSKVDIMKGEAPSIYANFTPTTANCSNNFSMMNYLQSAQMSEWQTGPNHPELYPEGNVWQSVSPYPGFQCMSAQVIKDFTYNGVGTIIVPGDLIISSDVLPDLSNPNSRLGFIVYGNVTIKQNVKVKASILSFGDININGDNVEMDGSFAANTFTIKSNPANIRFYYDYDLDSAWPPGFKYFSMPTPANK